MDSSRGQTHEAAGGAWRGAHATLACGLALVALLMALTGCAKPQAAVVTPPASPPLVVPTPPSRVLAPLDEPLASAPSMPEPDPDTPTAAPRAPARSVPRRAAAPVEPEVKPEPTPPPAVVEAARPAPTPGDLVEERKVRDVLARAARDLTRIDYRRLSVEGRSQYDQSKRFTDQTEQALRDRNFVFAATLADKAAALAAELAPR